MIGLSGMDMKTQNMAPSNKEHSLYLRVLMVLDDHDIDYRLRHTCLNIYMYTFMIINVCIYIYIYTDIVWYTVRTQHGSKYSMHTSERAAKYIPHAEDRSMRMLLLWKRRIKLLSPHFCKLFRRYDLKPGSFGGILLNMEKGMAGPQKNASPKTS